MSQVRSFEARSGSLDFDDDRNIATMTFQGTIGGDVQIVTMDRSAFDDLLRIMKQRAEDDPATGQEAG